MACGSGLPGLPLLGLLGEVQSEDICEQHLPDEKMNPARESTDQRERGHEEPKTHKAVIQATRRMTLSFVTRLCKKDGRCGGQGRACSGWGPTRGPACLLLDTYVVSLRLFHYM